MVSRTVRNWKRRTGGLRLLERSTTEAGTERSHTKTMLYCLCSIAITLDHLMHLAHHALGFKHVLEGMETLTPLALGKSTLSKTGLRYLSV